MGQHMWSSSRFRGCTHRPTHTCSMYESEPDPSCSRLWDFPVFSRDRRWKSFPQLSIKVLCGTVMFSSFQKQSASQWHSLGHQLLSGCTAQNLPLLLCCWKWKRSVTGTEEDQPSPSPAQRQPFSKANKTEVSTEWLGTLGLIFKGI